MTQHTTYCSKSWTDINIDFETRSLRHCCKAQPETFPIKLDLKFINNSDNIQQRRLDSLNNIEHPDCSDCWDNYRDTNSAYKDWVNKWDDDYISKNRSLLEQKNSDQFTHYIEIKTDKTCDMSCIYCSSFSSSKIAQEEGIEILDSTNKNDYDVFKQWIYQHVTQEEIKSKVVVFMFLGGEPTASENFYDLVDYIESLASKTDKIIRVEICTNANSKKYLMDKIINKMDTSKLSWGIGISNESYGEVSELIRHGLDWQRFEENFRRYIQHAKTDVIVLSPSVNIFNLKHFYKYVKWVYEQFKVYAPEKEFIWYGNFINRPGVMDIANLPASYIKYVELARNVALENTSSKQTYQDEFFKYFDSMAARINSSYDPNYKILAEQFLLKKQAVKKTDKLIKLMENLDL